jgi:methyl-accepting chemotaxis protein
VNGARPSSVPGAPAEITTVLPPPPTLLRPVLALAGRWSTGARLTVLVVLLLVPGLLATWSYTTTTGGQIGFSDRERVGNRVLRVALAATGAAVAGEAVDLAALHGAVEDAGELDLTAPLRDVDTAAGSADATTPAGRARVAAALGAFVTAVGNDSNLILDPDLDSFYVMDALVVQVPKALQAAAEAGTTPDAEGTALVAARALTAGQLSSAADAIASDIDTAVATTERPGLREELAGLAATAVALDALSAQLTTTLGSTAPADAAAVGQAAGAAAEPATAALDALLTTRVDGLALRRDVTLAVTVTGLLLASWFAVGVRWRTRRDVALALDGVTAIASGDLSERPKPDGRDEFGALGRALDDTRRRLAELEQEAAEARESRERYLMRSFAQQRMSQKHVRKQAQRAIDETAEAVIRELTAVMSHVEAVRQAAGAIETQVSTADGITQVMVGQAHEAGAVVQRLGDNLRDVAGMAHLISGVADQTKLLALNATIEAARAGEAGHGFSVVAGEVKELATATASSTEQISSTVTALEQDAAAMLASVTGVGSGVVEVTGTTATLAEVARQQYDLVRRLDESVGDALTRIRTMGSVTEKLERREAERFPANGFAEIRVGPVKHPAELHDLSVTGARLEADEIVPLRQGDTAKVDLPLGASGVLVDVEIVRDRREHGQHDLGVRFLQLSPAVTEQIVQYLETAASFADAQAMQ